MTSVSEAVSMASHSENISPYTAHLLAQISFLHKEVERLEKQLQNARTKGVATAREITEQYEKMLKEKSMKCDEWRNKFVHLNDHIEEEVQKRVSNLEKLTQSFAQEKLLLQSKNNELLNKLGDMKRSLEFQQNQTSEVEKKMFEQEAELSTKLNDNIKLVNQLSEENQLLKTVNENTRKVAVEMGTITDTQTDDKCTQIEDQAVLIEQQRDGSLGVNEENTNQNLIYLRNAVEQKTQELELYKKQLDELSVDYQKTLSELEEVKAQHFEEMKRKNLYSMDYEKLMAHITVLQQKLGETAASQRNLLEKVSSKEAEKQDALSSMLRVERDKNYLENQLHQYEKDIDHLISFKNISSAQLEDAAVENEKLQAELQLHIKKESQFAFTIKAKEEEIQDILEAYRSAVKENEQLIENSKVIERELDHVRGALSMKEDSILFLREQVKELNQREQQLILDIQSFEYDNDQLHRTILKNEGYISQLEKSSSDLKQTVHAKDVSIEELHHHLAELSKQVVVKENECMHLLRRCEDMESECTRLQASLSHLTQLNNQLEDSNARITARNVLDSSENQRCAYLENELNTLSVEVKRLSNLSKTIQLELDKERASRSSCEKSLQDAKLKIRELEQSKERLQQVIIEQTKTLSSLAT